jgi:hypothetical protein
MTPSNNPTLSKAMVVVPYFRRFYLSAKKLLELSVWLVETKWHSTVSGLMTMFNCTFVWPHTLADGRGDTIERGTM